MSTIYRFADLTVTAIAARPAHGPVRLLLRLRHRLREGRTSGQRAARIFVLFMLTRLLSGTPCGCLP